MFFDFYLSEMSVSDLHGGGLTLQRILGDDLMDINAFVYVNRFATDLPTADRYADRSIYIEPFWQRDTVRKKIGHSLAASLGRKLFMVRRHAAVAAKLLHKKFEDIEVLSVLVCPQGANAIFTLEALKALRPVKYVSWVMDDHLLEFIDGGWEYPKGVEPVFKKYLQEADHVFVISPAMQQFYLKRFGVESTVLFGSSDEAEIDAPHENVPGDALNIGYFGAVAGWQIDALEAFARAINGTKTTLHIYSGIKELPDSLNLPNVFFEGRLQAADVLPAMQNYNGVLLPISFTQKFRNMSQFNIATKMSEYLASGVPILALGPDYAAMITYLENNGAAITVTSTEVRDISNALDQLKDKSRVNRILNHAGNLVATETGNAPMRNRWVSNLQ
jgi:glycosyltransferase involved in cell wall biosynthesis